MRSGDLTEAQLKTRFHLVDISTKVNPYTLTKISPFSQPRSMSYNYHGETEKVTSQECARILFDEFRKLSRSFSLYGHYNHLIEKMIGHMQDSNGLPFQDTSLDRALKEHILRDQSTENSTRFLLQEALNNHIDWESSQPKR